MNQVLKCTGKLQVIGGVQSVAPATLLAVGSASNAVVPGWYFYKQCSLLQPLLCFVAAKSCSLTECKDASNASSSLLFSISNGFAFYT